MPAERWDGLLVIDKPLGMTSRAAVDRAQGWFPRGTRLGHTGTLDPLATGVLVLCIGQATRLAEFVQGMSKSYLTEITLGARSATDDGEGPITAVEGAAVPDRVAIDAALLSFVGTIPQVPPAFSAAKSAGRRSYDLARRGMTVALARRPVRIDRIDVVAYAHPRLGLEVHCGKGTYIRSLARDLGETLGCGAYVSALRRECLGPFTPEQAVPLDAAPPEARRRLLPIASAVSELPIVVLDAPNAAKFQRGQPVGLASGRNDGMPSAAAVAVFLTTGRLLGVGQFDRTAEKVHPNKVLHGD